MWPLAAEIPSRAGLAAGGSSTGARAGLAWGGMRSSTGVYKGHPLRGARKEGARIVEGVAASLAAGRDVAVLAVD